MSDPLQHWDRFAEDVRSRLEAGRREYGDRSFSAQPASLLSELRQELLDVCAWSYILATRLEALEARVAPHSAPADDVSELARERRHNAALIAEVARLRAEVARLRAELAAAMRHALSDRAAK